MNPIIESMNNYAVANQWSIDGGNTQKLSAGQLKFPMIWQQPLALTGKIGRNEGVLTYKFSCLLLEKKQAGNFSQKEEIREQLEKHALGLVHTLENHRKIQAVRLVSCVPTDSVLSQFGETAMTVTIEADILFTNNSQN